MDTHALRVVWISDGMYEYTIVIVLIWLLLMYVCYDQLHDKSNHQRLLLHGVNCYNYDHDYSILQICIYCSHIGVLC